MGTKTPPFTSDYEMYITPLMETLGLAEVTHDAKGNKMKAK